LIPINLNKLKQEDELHIYVSYRADLQTLEEFTLEFKDGKQDGNYIPQTR
jgi:hypothetical protein